MRPTLFFPEMVFACILARFDWEFVEAFFGLWVLPVCFADVARLSLADFLKNVNEKYDLALLNRVEHFSSQNDEKRLWFCGDFFKEKKKKDQSQFAAKRKKARGI